MTALLTDKEAAEILRVVTPKTLRRWVARGRIRGYRVGKEICFTQEDIQAYLQKAMVRPR